MSKRDTILILGDANSVHVHKWMLGIAKQFQVVVFSGDKVEEKYLSLYNDNAIILSDGEETVSNSKSISSYTKPLKRLKKIYKEYNPIITHAHYATSYGYLGALLKPKNFLISTWGTDVYDFPTRSFIHKTFFKWILSKATLIFATSTDLKKHTRLYTKRPIEIIPFGIDTQLFKPVKAITENSDIFTIGTVKGLNFVYGIDRLIHAFTIFHEKYPASKLLIYGKGVHEKEITALAETSKWKIAIELKGFIENRDVPKAIAEMDVFCALSRSESFGVAVIEASACEKPVVVSNIGGLIEVVDDQKTGIIVNAEDPSEIVNAFETLYLDKQKSVDMGKAGRQLVLDRFSWENNLEEQLTIYNKIINHTYFK